MSKAECIMFLLSIMAAIIFFGFYFEVPECNSGGKGVTWKSYPIVDYSLENGHYYAGTFHKSSNGVWVMKVSTED